MIKHRFIFDASFDIYGGFAGLYDFGPVGCALKNNMSRLWREHFILEEDMLEVSTPAQTPDIVFHHSGHKERFTDYVVQDPETNQAFRADHIIEDWVEKTLKEKVKELSEDQVTELNQLSSNAGGMNAEELKKSFDDFNILNAETGKPYGEVRPFNLMFQSKMGPMGEVDAFLRPETAQGMFVNFMRLLRCNNDKLPFGSATIGMGYRNEIAPRHKLCRAREFEMGEIEWFYDPQDPGYSRLHEVYNVEVGVFTADDQMAGKLEWPLKTIKECFDIGLLKNEHHGYFIGRTAMFLEMIGINKTGLRFRQHKPKEMAHYANDCWDAEVLTSYGWLECVGIADRSAYDLTCHTKGSKKQLVASRLLPEARKEQQLTIVLNKGLIGKTFSKKSSSVFTHFDEMDNAQKEKCRELKENGQNYTFTDASGEDFVIEANMIQSKSFFLLKNNRVQQ